MNCDDNCIWVVNKHNPIPLTCIAGYVFLCCVCNQVVVFGLSVSLSSYPTWMWWLL